MVDNESTDGTRELVESNFPDARVVSFAEPGLRLREQPRASNRPVRAMCCCSIPTRKSSTVASAQLVAYLDQPSRGRPGRGSPGDGRRHPVADDSALPQCPTGRGRGPFPPSAGRSTRPGRASASWTARPTSASRNATGPRGRSCSRAVRRSLLRACSTSAPSSTRRSRISACGSSAAAGGCAIPRQMTIVHHASKAGVRPRMVAQDAYARRQYAERNFSPARRVPYLAAVAARHVIRGTGRPSARRDGARLALRTLLGLTAPPFDRPPATALAARPPAGREDAVDLRPAAGAPRAAQRSPRPLR